MDQSERKNDLVQQPCVGICSKIERNRSLSKRCLCSGTILLHSLIACGRAQATTTAPGLHLLLLWGTREERLKTASAIKDSGNSQMIESLSAAPEGRGSFLELPALESGPCFPENFDQKDI